MPRKIVLVTGGAGHVGSHVIELLLENPENQVISLDNYSNGSEANHISGAEYRRGHTKDIDTVIPETPDIIYHLGEYARIAPSFEDVPDVVGMNILGTFQVAEFCRNRKVRKLVYAASSTKFAIEGDGRHQNPYSFTKAVNVDLLHRPRACRVCPNVVESDAAGLENGLDSGPAAEEIGFVDYVSRFRRREETLRNRSVVGQRADVLDIDADLGVERYRDERHLVRVRQVEFDMRHGGQVGLPRLGNGKVQRSLGVTAEYRAQSRVRA